MNQGKSALLSLIVGVVLVILAIKLLGAVLKIVGIIIAIAIAAGIFFFIQKQLGGPRAP